MTEDKYRAKYKELKRRVHDIEDENDLLHVRIHKARKSINRLRLERTFLLERMEKVHHHSSSSRIGNTSTALADSDHSDIGYDEDMYHTSNHGGKRGRIDKTLKTPKKKKDPNAPKGPGNVFFLYCRLERDKIKDEFPQENLGDVTKLLGQKWKGLTKDEKQKYYDMYRKEMEEYEEAMKTYVAGGGSANPTTAADADADADADVQVEADADAGEDEEEEQPVPDDVVAAAADDAAAAAAVGFSTMSSPTHLSSAASPPELHSDPIVPDDGYNDGDVTMNDRDNENDDTAAPAAGLATTASPSQQVPTSTLTQKEEHREEDQEQGQREDHHPSKADRVPVWRSTDETKAST
ncbi:hypothetical protein BDB00DRAFT_826237 [Zychaea mexicana]|uniref:uncharacterized protein n=1 Tax=Zychaea mexicana TaxID=64656 RepID=UPI0022FEFDEF|nr:uncharacterized protein BDB00DRAFT_826237 [Zychaea mexicana]KAI9492940.1 hypothetical protein BDB00DRAFT_826237 [Zychaea mexicana]